jgi:two-component system response regulator
VPNPVRRILLIEDNPGDVLLIREALRLKGIDFELEHIETADAGVRAVRNYDPNAGTPELILLDYNLPAGTARDVLLAMKENSAWKNVRKAVLTCSVSPRDREEAFAAGADTFVYKPADFDQFMENVGTAAWNLLNDKG